MADQR